MADLYQLWERPPAIEEYRSLCRAVGWEEFINFDAARASLANSLYHVVALHDAAVIGMARVVGDGACRRRRRVSSATAPSSSTSRM